MPKHLKTHWLYTIIFVLLLILDGIFMYMVTPNRSLQFSLVLVTALFYILWGIIHHTLRHDISAKVVVEYILVAILGVAVVFFFLKSGKGM